ncbi:dedicator of cytokinesis protein 3-like isoform X2 [Panonychus citri]|uniref:dedicator of cytokinesis protein 3-like isoform X2 n=1 Tax=Panonychus citri TaxID=50023 RepID=UPI0023075206|nr:dedicator of cytokinesis protein 3-like isoform X2 [Panonychus citri]
MNMITTSSFEIVKCLKDWHHIWKYQLYLNREVELFDKIGGFINDLLEWRRQLVEATLTKDQVKELTLKVTRHIDTGNRILGLDLVPRIDGQLVDPELISPIELYQIHYESSNGMAPSQRASNTSTHSSTFTFISNFLYLDVRDILLPLVNYDDNFELSFYLYDYSTTTCLSEKFVVRTSGASVNVANGGNHIDHPSAKGNTYSTIFTDLSNINTSGDVYLLVQVMRIGKMLSVEGKSSKSAFSSSTLPSSHHHHSTSSSNSAAGSWSNLRFKRPFGSAIQGLSDFLKSESNEKEFTLKLACTSNESDFFQVHDMLYKKHTNKLTQMANTSITVTVKFLTGPDSSKIINENAFIFQNVSCTTGKMGFPDVIMPGDVRNDLYLTLESGEFEKGGKSIPKNVEAHITLYGADAAPIINSISSGCGIDSVSTYTSQVLYHNNNPRWMESIKVLIPLEVCDLKAHIRIEFRHCSTKENQSQREKDKNFLGFCFFPLSDDKGTIIKDGCHELYLYKSTGQTEIRARLNDPSSYLSLPYGPKDDREMNHEGMNQLSRSSKESVHVRTQLCSTKLTQNTDLLTLLKWRSNPETVQDALMKVHRLNGEEVVKFLQDILDALFSMFSTHDGNQTHHSGLVFKVLLHILSLLDDPKYEHFKPVLDTYINGHFAAALVYKGLLHSVNQCTDLIKDIDSQESIQMCFRSLEWIFKFIVQSRILYARATGDHCNEDVFKQDLFTLFGSFKRMLSFNYEPTLVASQVAFIENFTSTYNQLLRVLVPDELTNIIKMIIDCLPCLEPCPQIIRAKLKCIHETISNELLLRDFEARRELIDLFTGHLKEHINRQQELKACALIISDILKFLHNEKINIASCSGAAISSGTITDISKEIDILVNTMLEPIVRVIVELSTTTSGLVNMISINLLHSYVSSFMTLLRLMDEAHCRRLLDKKNRKEKKELLLQIFYVFKQIFQPEMYNNDWTVMKMVANHIILCSLQEFSLALTEGFLGYDKGPTGSFDVQLWNSFFNLSVSFLTQSALQLENFSPSKREAILNKYQDMRVLMGFLILSMWEKLGDQKAHFIPSMVAPFLEVTLVPEKELRKATLPIFYDMIDAEFMSNGSFKQVESKLIDKLDILVSDYKGDDGFKQLFNAILLEKVNEQNPVWKELGIQMIHSITKLLELLLDYRSVMNGEENRDKRMSCTVNLLNFYKNEINRKEMYVRYIYKLCDLHIPAENYTEAAFTLKLHADLLNWSWNSMPRDALYSVEPLEWQRKESLYLAIIDYFDRGKCWEEGIPLIKELAEFYEKKLFDYQKLSNLLKQEARFFDNILTQLRPEPEYFRVCFFGKGFPIFLRNKVFIYRGLEYEKIGAFTARLQTEFPQSQLLTKNSAPDEKVKESEDQFIQICNVKPVAEPREEFEGKELPEKILSYYLVNDVKTFTFDRPIHKGPIDKDNEFKSLWIERTVLKIDCKLPGILRWFEVKCKPQVTELSPVQHARETIENMNKELQKLIASYTCEPTKALSPLTMRLQGVIEAAVNGGINKYHDAFFDPEYIAAHQAHLKDIKRLKQAILQQVRILEGGLSLHGRLVPANVKPLHKRLVERFTIMRQSILEKGSFDLDYQGIDEMSRKSASIINTPLPPIPTETKPSHYTSSHATSSTVSSNSSSASGTIGGFGGRSTDQEDQIYCVPHEYYGPTPPIPPSRNTPKPPQPPPIPHNRPRSAGFPANGLVSDSPLPSCISTPPPPPPLLSSGGGGAPVPASSQLLTHSHPIVNVTTSRQVPVSLPVNSSAAVQRSRSIPRTHHLYSTGFIGQQQPPQRQSATQYSPHSPVTTLSNNNRTQDDSEVPPLPPRNSNTLDKNRSVTIIPVDCRRGPLNIL